MEETKKLTNTERIKELEYQMKDLIKEKKKLEQYEALKEQADFAAAQSAIIRDSLIENGFSREEAFQLILESIRITKR